MYRRAHLARAESIGSSRIPSLHMSDISSPWTCVLLSNTHDGITGKAVDIMLCDFFALHLQGQNLSCLCHLVSTTQTYCRFPMYSTSFQPTSRWYHNSHPTQGDAPLGLNSLELVLAFSILCTGSTSHPGITSNMV